MNQNTLIAAEKLKDLLELANKSPQVLKLKQECDGINNGELYEISQKIIDDAFDTFETIVKNITKDEGVITKMQKLFFKHLFCWLLNSKNITIKD